MHNQAKSIHDRSLSWIGTDTTITRPISCLYLRRCKIYGKCAKCFVKSAHNRRCKVWIILIENCLITLSKYCRARTDVRKDGRTDGQTYGRRKRFLDLLTPSATQVKSGGVKQVLLPILWEDAVMQVLSTCE